MKPKVVILIDVFLNIVLTNLVSVVGTVCIIVPLDEERTVLHSGCLPPPAMCMHSGWRELTSWALLIIYNMIICIALRRDSVEL